MPLPEPKPGLVFRYDYLWSREAAAGRNQRKERPACLVAAMDSIAAPRYVVILAMTHRQPIRGTVGAEVPAKVRHAIGLDDAPCWIIVSEHNVDAWPNDGLAPLPGRPSEFAYGFIPPGLFAQVKSTFLELCAMGQSPGVRR